MVFNLEVDGQHVYHVANSGLLVHNDCPIDAVFGLDGHVQPFADSLAAAGHRIDRPPIFESLTDVSDNLKEGLRHAMQRSGRNHVTLDGFRQDLYDDWVRNGGPGSAPIPGGNNVTNWELHELFNKHLDKTTFYGGPGSNFIPWPF